MAAGDQTGVLAMADKSTKRKDEVELDPRGWERFERAVDAAVKTRPVHKTARKRSGRTIKKRKE
jgi:hypothetical protein